MQVPTIIYYCSQLIITNFFDDVLLDNEIFDVIDDEAVNLLALVSDEWILSFSATVSDLENDPNAAIVVEALDFTLINFPCFFDEKKIIANSLL